MFTSIWDDIKNNFRSGNMLTRIIILNVAVFLVILLANIFVKGFAGPEGYNEFLRFFMMSTDWWHNLTHPWVFITYMFMHESFWHIFWNMMLLYWFGNIVGDLTGDRVVLPTYLLSGLAGAIIYFIVGNLVGNTSSFWYIGGYMLGASASVNGFMMLAASKFPDYRANLPLLGPVRIKYIVAVFLIIDLVALSNNDNTGGHLAHLGGAATGWFIVYLWNYQNVDLIGQVNKILDSIADFFQNLFKSKPQRKSNVRIDYQQPKPKSRQTRSNKNTPPPTSSGQSHQEKLDGILDKIKVKGYDNLTAEEKEFLYNASKK